jgi:DNA helicase-2/ATP-dependent DNA helicase PcrA
MQDKSIKDEFISLRKKLMELDFSHLNEKQREAVFCTEGPLLILAGAGSGKTTVLINRIANLVKYGRAYESGYVPDCVAGEDIEILKAAVSGAASPQQMERAVSLCRVASCPAWRILAITFTNKAADELKTRLSNMLGYDQGSQVQASTFHSFCARILRRDAGRLGYSQHFAIYDTDDSLRLIKNCLDDLNISEKYFPKKDVLNQIGRAKDLLLTPDQYAAQSSDMRSRQIAEIYSLYQKKLMEADAMDFDDLLFNTVRLFRAAPDVLEKYRQRFLYLMVDEYQDTNHVQFVFVSMLAEGNGNLCVVGDDDQSIYKFRGATIENILGFEQQFKGCRVIRLEQNYRSTKNILNAANAVIAKNINRKQKTLWTQNSVGEKIEAHELSDEEKEGRFILDTVLDGVSEGRKFSDFAVLYRVNAQANALERVFVKSSVPYRIIGGHRFFDHMEIKDAVAYLRVISNPSDTVALQRIINQPRRGIGETTMQKAANIADGLGISLYEVLQNAADYPDISRAAGKIKAFVDIIEELRRIKEDTTTPVHSLYETMLEITGYKKMWEQQGESEAGRVDNLNELASSIIDYETRSEDDHPTLEGFLEEAALMTDIDNYDAASDAVVFMTMHSAKGLEFPVVFLPGFEEGIFPGKQTLFNPEELEEDRRLCYVAFTRAKEKIYIVNAARRTLYGSTTFCLPSRFLSDVPDDLIQRIDHGEDTSYLYGSYSYKTRVQDTVARTSGAGGGISALRVGSERSSGTARWQQGDIVTHNVFGKGEILSVLPMGNDYLLEIRFEKLGIKKVMANYAKLSPCTK